MTKNFISIHAPRAGSDWQGGGESRNHDDFNPRSPCGERPVTTVKPKNTYADFNPRSPCGERLGATILIPVGTEISIHAPRAGSD